MCQGRHQRLARYGKQGAKQTDSATRRFQREADRRHGCEPVDSASTDEPLQRGLRLILPLVAEQQVEHAGSAAPAGEQRESRGSGLLLNCCARVRAVPPERSVGNGVAGEPAPHLGGFGCRFGAQPMVDTESTSHSSPGTRPAIGQQAEREAVRTAGDRDRDPRRRFERPEGRHERVEGRRIDGCSGGFCAFGRDDAWRGHRRVHPGCDQGQFAWRRPC